MIKSALGNSTSRQSPPFAAIFDRRVRKHSNARLASPEFQTQCEAQWALLAERERECAMSSRSAIALESGSIKQEAHIQLRDESVRRSSKDLYETHRDTDHKKLPYATLIRGLLHQERIRAARTLLAIALQDSSDAALITLSSVLAFPRVTVVQERDPSRREEFRWLEENRADHRGKWVALVGDRLVAEAATRKELRRSLSKLDLAERPLIHRLD